MNEQVYRPNYQQAYNSNYIQQQNISNELHRIFTDYRMVGNEKFRQFVPNGFQPEQLPIQGWKLHISAENLEDYLHLLKTIGPELVANNVNFKCVLPEHFANTQYDMNTGQFDNKYGKEITIYLTDDIKWNRFSKRFFDALNTPCTKSPRYDLHFGGRINARFGGIRSFDILCPDFKEIPDQREKNTLPFIKEKSLGEIINFFNDVENRYKRTGDIREYYSSRMVGTKCSFNKDMIIINGNYVPYINEETRRYDDGGKHIVFMEDARRFAMECKRLGLNFDYYRKEEPAIDRNMVSKREESIIKEDLYNFFKNKKLDGCGRTINGMNEVIKPHYDNNIGRKSELQHQGWEIAVSASNLREYHNMIKVMYPELVKNHVDFQFVNPFTFPDKEYDSSNNRNPIYGNEILIKVDRNLSKAHFSKEFMSILEQPSKRHSKDHINLEGRTSVRYGSLGFKRATPPDKEILSTNPAPDWAIDRMCWEGRETSIEDIMKFYDHVDQIYQENHDLGAYYSSIVAGVPCETANKQILILPKEIENVKELRCLSNLDGYTSTFYNDQYLVDASAVEMNYPEFQKICFENGIEYNYLFQDGSMMYDNTIAPVPHLDGQEMNISDKTQSRSQISNSEWSL